MLAKTFDYLRIAETKPSDETVSKRKSAATELLSTLSGTDDPALLAAATAATVAGLDTASADESPIVKPAYEAIRKHAPATPSSWREIHLDLRACTAIALGELIAGMEKAKTQEAAVLAAALTLASRGVRAPSQDRFVELMLADLESCARDGLSALAAKKRARSEWTQSTGRKTPTAELLATPDLTAAYIKTLIADSDAKVDQLRREIGLDREELDTLWWLHGGSSTSFDNRPFASLPRGDAALAAAMELESASSMPPSGSCEAMLSEQLNGHEASTAPEPISLKRLLSDLDAKFRGATLVGLAEGRDLAKQFPQVLPLTWVLTRIDETQGLDTWTAEAPTVVGAPLDQQRTPAQWSCLLFRERVALRLARDFQEA